MPGHARTGTDHRMVGAVVEEADVTGAEHQHGAGQVLGDQHVAAAAQHQQRAVAHLGQCQHVRQQCGVVQFQQLCGAGLHRRHRATAGRFAAATDRLHALGDQGRATEDQAAVALHQRGTGGQLGHCSGAGQDAADTDQRYRLGQARAQAAQHQRGLLQHRCAGQAAGFVGPRGAGARKRGV
ncbi:hypothetical protein G6F66_014044 [Rhizopus arrhizus]|nr:hypothetical protein G6F66_014044 [Rhizopus arrhizus]